MYICDGGLEQIREICGATKGRKPTPVIETGSGNVQGFIDPDSRHAVFRGIPFAAAPVDDMRWRPPGPAKKWPGVLNASEFGPTCKQNGPAWSTMGGVRNSSEDCLYLNVYVPTKVIQRLAARAGSKGGPGERMPEQRPPTLIYFPAGQFMWGSGNDAENFIAPQTPAGAEIIVVTANYRLGAAGYLALDELRDRDPAGSTGNYGTLDQRTALLWIKTNIGRFGGDPDNVVLWGESAGAAAVTAHLVMPKSWPYFDKAIMESAAFNGWSYKAFHDATANARALAKHLNCTKRTNKTVSVNVSCMLEVSIEKLIMYDDDGAGQADGSLGMPFGDRIDRSLWAPAVDGVELSGPPTALLKAGKVAKVPMLFGTNRDEGSTFTYNQTGTGDGHSDTSSMYDGFLYDPEQYAQHSSSHGGSVPQNFSTGMFVNASEFAVWASNFFGANLSEVLLDLYRPWPDRARPHPLEAPEEADTVFNPEGIYNWWWSMSRVIGDFVLSCPARRAAKTLAADGHAVFV